MVILIRALGLAQLGKTGLNRGLHKSNLSQILGPGVLRSFQATIIIICHLKNNCSGHGFWNWPYGALSVIFQQFNGRRHWSKGLCAWLIIVGPATLRSSDENNGVCAFVRCRLIYSSSNENKPWKLRIVWPRPTEESFYNMLSRPREDTRLKRKPMAWFAEEFFSILWVNIVTRFSHESYRMSC